MTVVAAELICREGDHAVLNAGLLKTIRIAYAEASLLFLADRRHLAAVKEVLIANGVDGVDYRATEHFGRHTGSVRSLPSEFAACRYVLQQARGNGSSRVLFCSVNAAQMLALKFLLRVEFREMTVMAIPHSILHSSLNRPGRKPWDYIVWFRNCMRRGNLSRLRIVTPGESIRDELLTVFPDLLPYVSALNIAYLFPGSSTRVSFADREPLRFGFVGVGGLSKGIDLFDKLAADTRTLASVNGRKLEFVVAGPIGDCPPIGGGGGDLCWPSSKGLLAPGEIADIVQTMHYAVFPYRRDQRRLVASAAILDAFAWLKPVIVLRDPYFEYCFRAMGDIGHLCDSYSDLLATVSAVAAEFPLKRYLLQVENIRRGRVIFSPEMLAPRLRVIMESMRH